MCTLVLLRRPGAPWPVLIAANRDEMQSRPWKAPGRHWSDRPETLAGLDELSGGSWLGVNDHGLVAGILNRRGSLGPAAGKRSRGEVVLEALEHAEAETAAKALGELEGSSYRSFNMLVADSEKAFWIRNEDRDDGDIDVFEVPEGISVFTAYDVNDPESARVRRALPRFRIAAAPDPETGHWSAWENLLADRTRGNPADYGSAINLDNGEGFATVSSSLIALPADPGRDPVWRFAPGKPDEAEYETVDLGVG
ncbi:NRDE family protein [Nisaea acidiphila]|uniref:NRDE family protein n=1 Tax=Nisaea acidiphila TaxID=1862145 RepID=A0A9J7ATP9_9PROT|nr:NRDE family protein [Nisaea acidiphila]UUX49700.1 NRDE family protein [Nisaea acidiphila]